MSVGFGFSTGEFIAALRLVQTVIDAFRESGKAGTEYRELLRELYSLEQALLSVNRLELELDEAYNAELVALQQAATQCQRTIDEFSTRIAAYHRLRRGCTLGIKIKDRWTMIKWAVFKKDDIAQFKADLMMHTQSIQVLMATTHMANVKLRDQKEDDRSKSLAGRIQESYFTCMKRLECCTQQGKELLELASRILRTNIQVFQIVLDIQKLITKIPGQVNRQQPVYFVDATGRHCPFYLEFIQSRKAFVAVLESNFEWLGSAADMIRHGDFAIQDEGTDEDIDLSKEWGLCFFPRQRVCMSMIFMGPSTTAATTSCPRCKTLSKLGSAKDIECLKCGLLFRRVVDIRDEQADKKTKPLSQDLGESLPGAGSSSNTTSRPQKPLLKRKRFDTDTEMTPFRRVRVRNIRSLNPQDKRWSRQYNRSTQSARLKVYELKDGDWFDRGTGFGHGYIHDEIGCIFVTSEEEPEISLLDYTIERNCGPQKQQDTLIVWTELSGIDMALSFEDPAGCDEIWTFFDSHYRMLQRLRPDTGQTR